MSSERFQSKLDMTVADIIIHCNELALTQPIEDKHLRSLPQSDEPYYAFLYYLAQVMKPKVVVELGVFRGVGLAHLAAGCPTTQAIGIDNYRHDWDRAIDPYPNARAMVADSCTWLKGYTMVGDPLMRVGILHIDTEHTYEQVKSEFALALPLIANPGVICLDDITYSEKMARFWAEIKLPKLFLPNLHVTGYGVCLNI